MSRVWRLHPSERVPPRPVDSRGIPAATVETWTWAKLGDRAGKPGRDEAGLDEVEAPWRGCSSLAWPSITILGMILLVVSLVSMVQSIDRRDGSGRRGAEETASRSYAGVVPVGRVPKVTAFEVRIRGRGGAGTGGAAASDDGVIGRSAWEAKCGDSMRVSARLDLPAYCYLVSLMANGGVDVVDPPGQGLVPVRTDRIEYPRSPEHVARLSQGPGLQALLLVVASEPLPAFADWPARGPLKWRSTQAGAAWRSNGREIERLEEGADGVRVRFFDTPKSLQRVCNMVQGLKGVDACELIAFPVKPKAED